MGKQFITVCELNLQGEKWKKKEEEEIWKQIEKLKNALDALAKDIIILTAVCDKQWEIIKDQLKDNYELVASKIVNTFRVIIGVNKSFGDLKLIEVTIDKSTDDIDLLKVRFEVKEQLKEQSFTVIGCRFTTGIVNKEQDKDKQIQEMRKQYDSERAAFDSTLLPFISESIEGNKNDVFVLAGDFNNARCCGDLDSVGDYTYEEGGVTKERPQINFNLQLIKDRLKQYDFEMADIRKDEKGRKQPIPTHKIFPIDHIFVRGLTVKEDNVCGTITVGDLSDHAIIWADFDMKE